MRVQRLRITAAFGMLLMLVGVTGVLVRQQAAQDMRGTTNQPRTVLIEKDRIVTPSSLPAQPEIARVPGPLDEQDAGQPRSFISAASSFENKLVKGAPFSAELVIETSQPLPDGTSATRRLTSMLYRDGEGRTRRDRMAEQISARRAAGNQPRLSVINDSVAGVTYVLEHRAGIARRKPLLPARDSNPEEPSQTDESAALDRGKAPAFMTLEPRRVARNEAGLRGAGTPTSSSDTKREMLGQREIEGLTVEGTRLTRVIPAGAFGNDQPIEIVAERWYSPQLQTVVLTKRNDPRFGESVYRLTNINRSEPAPTVFEVPSGYKIRDEAASSTSRNN